MEYGFQNVKQFLFQFVGLCGSLCILISFFFVLAVEKERLLEVVDMAQPNRLISTGLVLLSKVVFFFHKDKMSNTQSLVVEVCFLLNGIDVAGVESGVIH